MEPTKNIEDVFLFRSSRSPGNMDNWIIPKGVRHVFLQEHEQRYYIIYMRLPSDRKETLYRHWIDTGIIHDFRLLNAFQKVKRENFILKGNMDQAYGDYPLPLPNGQTISQPTTVMLMTQALKAEEGMKVLEVGTGSGYQAAILSEIVGEKGRIISVEYFKALSIFAIENLKKSGCRNTWVIHGDGGDGWKEEAPYDRVIVTCACPSVPNPLLEQLSPEGIMVIPVTARCYEEMRVIQKTAEGISSKSIGSFAFVPLRGIYGKA